MGWHKKKGAYEVYCYDPSIKRKRYVGRRKLEREAKDLYFEKTREFKGAEPETEALSIDAYADEWLSLHHGDGTPRPELSTERHNRQQLRVFRAKFGHRPVDGGVSRREALAWAKQHPSNARAVSAMFNDAVDDEVCKGNPFANRRQSAPRGRKDIAPITETELGWLEDIALSHWGEDGYGLTARAWVRFGARVGCRPGETFSVPRKNLRPGTGEVAIRRVKKRNGKYPTDVVVLPSDVQAAIDAMPEIPGEGPMFRTVTGKRMVKGALKYHFDPVRAKFQERVMRESGDARWLELLGGQDGFDFYSLRHYVASMMADRGASAREIAHQLGNSPRVCEETYIHGYRDRMNERNRLILEGPAVADLSVVRERKSA